MCILIVLCSVFLNWVCWARGNFSGEPGHVHIRVWVPAVWSAGPVRVYLGTSLVWAAGLYGFSIFPGSVLAGMVRLKWWGGVLCFPFHFPQFLVSSLGGWICAVGILRYIFYGIL